MQKLRVVNAVAYTVLSPEPDLVSPGRWRRSAETFRKVSWIQETTCMHAIKRINVTLEFMGYARQ
jgi:hypothetical protein